MVYDPVVIFRFKRSAAVEGEQSEGEVWNSTTYELPPDEVLEIFGLQINPPVDTANNVIKKLKYATITINNDEYPTIRVNSIMMPLDDPTNPSVAVPLGVPYLHRPIIGRLPNPVEGACPKLKPGDRLGVRTVAAESITQDYEVVLYAARVRGRDKLREVLGASEIAVSFALDTDFYSRPTVTVDLERFNELPGGLGQPKPKIFSWVTWSTNAVATTPNEWFTFDYPGRVSETWQILYWNLVTKTEAYLVSRIGVLPHANSRDLRLWVEGRTTLPEFPTRPLPEWNYFPPALTYSTATNATLKRTDVPRKLAMPALFHGVKGGIQIRDNGTAIPAGGVEIHVYGTKFELR